MRPTFRIHSAPFKILRFFSLVMKLYTAKQEVAIKETQYVPRVDLYASCGTNFAEAFQSSWRIIRQEDPRMQTSMLKREFLISEPSSHRTTAKYQHYLVCWCGSCSLPPTVEQTKDNFLW